MQKRHKGQVAGEMPESQSCASMGSKVGILQSACTQFCFHWNQWAVANPEQEVSHQLWLRRAGCKKIQVIVQKHMPVVWERVILVNIITVFAKWRGCSVLFTWLMLSVVVQVKAPLCCVSPSWIFSMQVKCYFSCSAVITFLLSHNSSRKTSMLEEKLPSHCSKILYNLW